MYLVLTRKQWGVHSNSRKFFLKANKRYQTYQLNTCLKLAIEVLEQGIKYVQN